MKLFHGALLAAALVASTSVLAAGPSKAVPLTDAQMDKVTAGALYQSNSAAGSRYASAWQSDNSNAYVYQSRRITTCVNACF